MARGYMPGGGGGGGSSTSDDCTATKAQVLEGYTAITSDSDDEAEEGTMPNRGNQQKATSVTTGNNNMYFRTPAGYYSTTGSEESDKPEVYAPYADVAAKGGVTSAKLLAGQSALGVNGEATNDANAVASDMASGKSGYVKGKKVNGSLAVYGAGATKAPSGWSDSDKVYFSISRGIYNTRAPGDPNYAQVYRLKSDLGITAGKIAQGQSICGTSGSYTSDGNIGAGDVRKNKIAYSKGTRFTGTMAEQGGSTVTPGTANKTAVASGRYVTGNIIVAGDADLKADNIKKGVNIFGVTGTFSGYVATATDLYLRGQNPGAFACPDANVQFESGAIYYGTPGPIGGAIVKSGKTYNLSSYSKVNFEVRTVSNNIQKAYIAIYVYDFSSGTDRLGIIIFPASPYGSDRTVSLDVSGVNKNCKIGFDMRSYSNSDGTGAANKVSDLQIFRIWLS